MLYKESVIPLTYRGLASVAKRVGSNIAYKASKGAHNIKSAYQKAAPVIAKGARISKPIISASMQAAKVPYNVGKFVGTQAIKRPKATLAVTGTTLLAKDSIQNNLRRVNPLYTKEKQINI